MVMMVMMWMMMMMRMMKTWIPIGYLVKNNDDNLLSDDEHHGDCPSITPDCEKK